MSPGGAAPGLRAQEFLQSPGQGGLFNLAQSDALDCFQVLINEKHLGAA